MHSTEMDGTENVLSNICQAYDSNTHQFFFYNAVNEPLLFTAYYIHCRVQTNKHTLTLTLTRIYWATLNAKV